MYNQKSKFHVVDIDPYGKLLLFFINIITKTANFISIATRFSNIIYRFCSSVCGRWRAFNGNS